MTDKEMVLHLCQKLKLRKVEKFEHHESTYVEGPKEIIVGSGFGFNGSYVIFEFDLGENITAHGVIEYE